MVSMPTGAVVCGAGGENDPALGSRGYLIPHEKTPTKIPHKDKNRERLKQSATLRAGCAVIVNCTWYRGQACPIGCGVVASSPVAIALSHHMVRTVYVYVIFILRKRQRSRSPGGLLAGYTEGFCIHSTRPHFEHVAQNKATRWWRRHRQLWPY